MIINEYSINATFDSIIYYVSNEFTLEGFEMLRPNTQLSSKKLRDKRYSYIQGPRRHHDAPLPLPPLGLQEHDSENWRQSLLVALPFGVLAFMIGSLLEQPSDQTTTFDLLAYPLMSIFLLGLELLLYRGSISFNKATLTIVFGCGLFFSAKLVYILFAPQVPVQVEMTETFFWTPAMYLLSFFIPQKKGGGRLGAIIYTLVTCLISISFVTSIYTLHQPFSAKTWGVVYALLQLNLANTVLLALTFSFIHFKEQYTFTRARMQAAEDLVLIDTLTQLPNRLAAEQHLEELLHHSPPNSKENVIALVLIDIDGFKLVNDTLGHDAGDEALRLIAKQLKQQVRYQDMVVRLSGDEFMVILEALEQRNTARHIANRIRMMFSAPLILQNQRLFLTASIGISLYPDHGTSAIDLIRHADSAMNRVKKQGKNDVQFYSSKLDKAREQQQDLEKDLHLALENQRFSLMYQPMYHLQQGGFAKAEALLRWRHPEKGFISPADFIPIAERSGLILSIGPWVLEQACLQASTWYRAGLRGFRVCVNISALQFAQSNFLETVIQALEKSYLPPEYLELELTESMVKNEFSHITTVLKRLRELGISISIDDFGTGYSSLAYLRDLPVDVLKIDKHFIQDLGKPRQAPQFPLALVEAIMTLAQHLDLEVVAEGIEHEAQAELLKRIGCHVGQGYWFAKPLPVQDIFTYVTSHQHKETDTVISSATTYPSQELPYPNTLN